MLLSFELLFAASLGEVAIAPRSSATSSAEAVLAVRETAGILRSGEVVRSGVPLPRSLDVRNLSALNLVDAAGSPVPAEFQVLARWNMGLNSDAPIQWLLVSSSVSVAANQTVTYRLVINGPATPKATPPVAISLTRNGDQVIVDTGAATFKVGGDLGALFDEIRLANGAVLVTGSSLTARVNGVDVAHTVTRRVYVEHAGPLIAVVVVEGAYDLTPVAGGGLSSFRRYVFTAGSPTVIVRHVVKWEGSRCGNGVLVCDGLINGLRLQQVRDALSLNLRPPLSAIGVGAFQAAALQRDILAGQTAWIRQRLRTQRTDPLVFDLNVAGATASGAKADGAILSISGTSGTVAIALNHMHRFEPQALRFLNDGRLAVDLADDQVWLGARQGMYGTFAVTVLPNSPSRATLDQLLWAPLNRPLRAWAPPAWFADSGAVDEFPVGVLPSDLAAYDSLITRVLTYTMQQVDEVGLPGLMTFGVYPRYWGKWGYNEVDCSGNDPTPSESWDNSYWCGSWTDYHNTISTAPIWAMRSGEVQWLDEIAFPGALRTLHTQIMQCAPADTYFYCGQAPAGYGGYRADFNSSHAYFDNLFLYYWLTGDYSVVEILKRGASSMRNYLCSRRPANTCLPNDQPLDPWAQLSGRVASQWLATFRFVGLASDDATYLDDWQSGLARAVTQYYVEATQTTTRYGFWVSNPVAGPGTYATDQLWMASLYDMKNLDRLRRETNDAALGNPSLPPSQVLSGWARTLVRFGSTTLGDGTASGTWPNQLDFAWSGDRIGGTLISVSAHSGGGDPTLYDTGKSTLTAVLLRAGKLNGEDALIRMGADLTKLALNAALNDGSPLGKLQGLYLARLHAAIYILLGPGFVSTFNTNPTNFLGATSAGSITACSGTYYNGQSSSSCPSSFPATANPPTPSSDWQFHHWEWSSGVSCSSNIANPTSCTVSSSGSLNAVYAAKVTFFTNPSVGSISWGSCSNTPRTNGQSIFDSNLPPEFSNSITACANAPSGYTFQGWSCSGGLACSGSSTPTTVTFTGPGSITATFQIRSTFDFSVSNSGGISVVQGGSQSNTITVTLLGGSTQSVSLSCTSGVPSGASCSFNPFSGNPTFSSTLTITTSSSTPTGSPMITVTGTGGGLTRTTQFTLMVNAPPPGFDFSLSNSGGITVTQGGSGSNTITVTLLSGSTQSVSLSCTAGLPSGASCTGFNPPSGNPTFTSTLTITTSVSTATGSYPITVSGAGGGLSRATQFSLTVSGPSGDLASTGLSVAFPAGAVSVGSFFTVGGTLKGTWHELSGVVSGKQVVVRGSWGASSSTMTRNDGTFTVALQAPGAIGTYALTVQFAGDAFFQSSSANGNLIVQTLGLPTTLYVEAESRGSLVAISGLLQASTGAGVPGRTITLKVYSFGVLLATVTATTDSSGYFLVSVNNAPNASSVVASFVGDVQYQQSSASVSVAHGSPALPNPNGPGKVMSILLNAADVASTSLSVNFPAAPVAVGATFTIQGILRGSWHELTGVVSSKQVCATRSWSATPICVTTAGDGLFAVSMQAPASVGTYGLTFQFAGDAFFLGSSANGSLVVQTLGLPTTLYVEAESRGSLVTISGLLQASTGAGVPGRVITLKVYSFGVLLATVTATTDSTGYFLVTVYAPNASSVTATFTGDSSYQASTATAAVLRS